MLFIETISGKTYSWHVGEQLPDIEPNQVTRIQADCDERIFLYEFIGEFHANYPVAIYEGSIARTCFIFMKEKERKRDG